VSSVSVLHRPWLNKYITNHHFCSDAELHCLTLVIISISPTFLESSNKRCFSGGKEEGEEGKGGSRQKEIL
jgi:hypothetical protein